MKGKNHMKTLDLIFGPVLVLSGILLFSVGVLALADGLSYGEAVVMSVGYLFSGLVLIVRGGFKIYYTGKWK